MRIQSSLMIYICVDKASVTIINESKGKFQ